MTRLYRWCGGKSVFFALVFTAAGLTGFFIGKLNGAQFLTFAGIIHGWVAVRSMMDDYHERNKPAEAAAGGKE